MSTTPRTPGDRGSVPPWGQGFTLVELMLALVLGLFVIGSGASLLLGQWDTQRRQVLASRLQQEMRHALELIVRDLMRAGHWHHAGELLPPESATQASTNPYQDIVPIDASASTLAYSYDRNRTAQAVQATERYGWRINPNTNALEMRLSGASLLAGEGDAWQAVSDPQAVRWRALSLRSERLGVPGGETCSAPCATGATDCPPQASLRRVTVELEGSAPLDAQLQRRLSATVQLRAPLLQGRCPA
jgi:prepilin-type N-terminal cleavage/methylation domain-containing protein